MNGQNLKNSILQLAIQGKLVEQRPEEGTAKELIEKIEIEKDQLVKEKFIKKQKSLPDISVDEKPFDIPHSWEWLRLGDLISISSGKGLTSKQMKKGEIPVFGGNGITGYHDTANISKETVVIGRVGYYCGSVHVTPEKAWVTDNAFITTFPEKNMHQKFLVYVLEHLKLGRDNNATAQPVVSGKKIYPILFPLPPLEEQKRIVEKIEELMPYVDKYDKAYSEAEELNKKFSEDMQKSILQFAIQGKLVEQREEEGTAEDLYQEIQEEKKRLIEEGKIKKTKVLPEISEDEIPFDVPESWKWVNLHSISSKITDGEHKTPKRIEKFVGYYLLSARNVLNGEITLNNVDYVDEVEFNKISKRCNPKKGDILISCSGSVGRCSVVKDDNDYVMVRSAAMVSTLVCDPEYIMYAIQSGTVQKQIKNLTKQTAQANLFLGAINQLIVPLPPIAEQRRIVDEIKRVLPYTSKLEIKNIL